MTLNIDNIRGPSGPRSVGQFASPETSGGFNFSKGFSQQLQAALKLLDMILKMLEDPQGGKGQGPGGPPPMQPPAGLPPPPSAAQQQPPVPPQQPPVPPQQPPAPPQQPPAPPQQPPAPPQQPPVPPQQQAPGQATGPDLSPQQIGQTYGKEIQAASSETGVPPDVLAGMIWQESKGRPNTPGGGLMQVGPNEFASHGGGDINNAGDNIMAGARYMQELLQQFGGNMELALRAYNSGPNGVDRGDPHATPAGTGDPTYIPKVLDAAAQSGL